MAGKLVHMGGKTYRVNLKCELTESAMILCSRVKPVECHKCEHYKRVLSAPDFYRILKKAERGI